MILSFLVASAHSLKAPPLGPLTLKVMRTVPGAHGGSTRAGAGPLNPAAGAEERLPFTLSQLVAFCTLARAGSFRAAALALAVSQPAVSKSIALLEQARCPACVRAGRAIMHATALCVSGARTAAQRRPSSDPCLASAGCRFGCCIRIGRHRARVLLS